MRIRGKRIAQNNATCVKVVVVVVSMTVANQRTIDAKIGSTNQPDVVFVVAVVGV